nr:MAG TPA: hypothetical protein [Caudoviricetes sp.]
MLLNIFFLLRMTILVRTENSKKNIKEIFYE